MVSPPPRFGIDMPQIVPRAYICRDGFFFADVQYQPVPSTGHQRLKLNAIRLFGCKPWEVNLAYIMRIIFSEFAFSPSAGQRFLRSIADTDVLVRAAVAPQGPARAVLELGTSPPHVIVISDFIFAEVRRALGYPRVRQRYAISDTNVDEFDSLLRAIADTVAVPAASPILAVDPDDDPIIATAIIGQSDVLCTRDRHLRQPLIQAYCATFNIRVFTDLELLAELRASAIPPH
jgi:uncharacterized protein